MLLIRLLLGLIFLAIIGVGVLFFINPEFRNYSQALYHYNQGLVAYEQGDYVTARAEFSSSLKGHLEPAQVYMRLGDTENQLGYVDEALENYQKALDRDPTQKEAILNIARYEWSLEHYRIALALVKSALEEHPDDADLEIQLADMYLDTAKRTGDDEAYDKAIAIYQKYWDQNDYTRYKTAEAYYGQGHYNKALPIYCELANKNPLSPETLYSLALTLGKLQALEEAFTTMSQAAELKGLYHDELALRWIHQAQEYQQRRSVYSGPPDQQVFVCMLRLKQAQKEAEKAVKD